MQGFQIPPQGFGPGSQPAASDGQELSYLPMPSGMRTYSEPCLDVENPDAVAPALAMLAEVAEACAAVAEGAAPTSFALDALNAENLRLISETLGEGEVSGRLDLARPLTAREAVFAGVWRVASGGRERIEVAPAPVALLGRAFEPLSQATGSATPCAPGVVNGPGIVAELLDAAARWRPGDAAHVVSLTLMPHTPEDLDHLDAALGRGAARILSRGYGGCRIAATAVRNLWRVQFTNAMDTMILDSFEVCDAPAVALAAPEDLADSAERIREVLEALR
jgi:hydrogenase-1 operon protein HyaF